jgi:hypothetical protein
MIIRSRVAGMDVILIARRRKRRGRAICISPLVGVVTISMAYQEAQLTASGEPIVGLLPPLQLGKGSSEEQAMSGGWPANR